MAFYWPGCTLNSVRLHLVTSPTARSHAVSPRKCLHTFSPTPNPSVCCDCCFPSPFQATLQLTSMTRIARSRPTPILPCCFAYTLALLPVHSEQDTVAAHIEPYLFKKIFFCDFHLFSFVLIFFEFSPHSAKAHARTRHSRRHVLHVVVDRYPRSAHLLSICYQLAQPGHHDSGAARRIWKSGATAHKPSSSHRPRQQAAAAATAGTADPSQCSGSETTRLLDSGSNNMVRTSGGSIPQVKCHRFLHQVWPCPDEAAAGRGHVSPRPGQQHAAEHARRLRTTEGETDQQLRQNKMAASFHAVGHAQPGRPQTQPHDEWDVGPPSHRQ